MVDCDPMYFFFSERWCSFEGVDRLVALVLSTLRVLFYLFLSLCRTCVGELNHRFDLQNIPDRVRETTCICASISSFQGWFYSVSMTRARAVSLGRELGLAFRKERRVASQVAFVR